MNEPYFEHVPDNWDRKSITVFCGDGTHFEMTVGEAIENKASRDAMKLLMEADIASGRYDPETGEYFND